MSNGDILSELRAWRNEFARSHGYDIRAMSATLSELHNTGERKVVLGNPRQPASATTPNQSVQPTKASISVSLDSTSPG
jgi:hypothetical protein